MEGKGLIVFDMDGTVMDSSRGIIHCFRETGRAIGKTDITEESLRSGLGGQFVDNLVRILELPPDKETIDSVAHRFIAMYSSVGLEMSEPFEGMREALEELGRRGYVLCVATLNKDDLAKGNLKRFGLDTCFASIHGADLKTRITKADMIRACMAETGIDAGRTVMIGDSGDDESAAAEAGVRFIPVCYGYGFDKEKCRAEGREHLEAPSDCLVLFS